MWRRCARTSTPCCATTGGASDLRRGGARVLRVAQRPGGQALKEHRAVCFLAFDGHCYMYRAVRRVLERAARVLYRGEARQTLPPIQEWRRFDAADVQPGLFWCEDLREDETYFLDPEGIGWSAPRARTTGTPGRRWRRSCASAWGLRSVSFQLPCEEDVQQSAFEDKPLCAAGWGRPGPARPQPAA